MFHVLVSWHETDVCVAPVPNKEFIDNSEFWEIAECPNVNVMLLRDFLVALGGRDTKHAIEAIFQRLSDEA